MCLVWASISCTCEAHLAKLAADTVKGETKVQQKGCLGGVNRVNIDETRR